MGRNKENERDEDTIDEMRIKWNKRKGGGETNQKGENIRKHGRERRVGVKRTREEKTETKEKEEKRMNGKERRGRC